MSPAPIRVLHAAASLGLGGTEKVMQLLTANLDHARFEVAVHSPQDGPRAAQIRAAGVATWIGMDLLDALDHFRPQVVHLHRAGWPEPERFRPLRRYAGPDGPPVIVETNVFGRHDPSPDGAHIDRTLFVSRFCAERFGRLNRIDPVPPRYSVLYNPVDTDLFGELGAPDFESRALARVSRSDPGKWSHLALDMLPHLARLIPDFTFHVIGAVPEAVEFVRAHGLADHVVFHDPVETDRELAAFLNRSALLAHANDTGESFGLTIAEAMACGLPVVTHPCPEPRDNAQLELVDHGVTGLVAATAEEYAGAVAMLLADPDLARRMGAAGREKARRLFRARDIARQLETIYLDLLASKGIKHAV